MNAMNADVKGEDSSPCKRMFSASPSKSGTNATRC